MNKFFQFVENHWVLWLALVVALVLLVYEELKDRLHGVKRLSAAEVTQLINRDEAVIIDVRDRQVFGQGHIIDSINFMPTELEANGKLDKYKNKTIVIVDAAGQSAAVANKLMKQGFSKVYLLAGGMNGWRNLGLPVTKK